MKAKIREAAERARIELTDPTGELAARRATLMVTRVNPWSVCKVSLMLSVALGIMMVVASVIVWFLLDSMHVFAAVQDVFVSVGSESFGSLIDYVKLDRVVSVSIIISIINIILLTALSTLGALLYNVVAALVGGVKLTLTDD